MANLPVISSIDDENYILYGIIETTNQYLINTNSININSHEYYQLYHDQNKEIKYLTNSRYSLNQTTFDTQYIVGGGMFYTYYE
jgi:hypothetical protein